ncbi:MAG: outer membrane protein assembly factor BamD [Tepidisphaeraceae bacterium]|jgi:outer membrane assembly lipoprotein YfiO
MGRWIGAFFLGILCVGAAAWGQEKRTWEFRDGMWTDAQPTPTTAPVVEPDLDRAEQLLVQHQHKAARKILLEWEKHHQHSPGRDRCIFLLAEAFFQDDSRTKAFYYCDELMDEYPSSPLFEAALQKQFDIADAYLNGYKRQFLWFRFIDASDDGIEMLYRIQQRAPGSPLAEQALLHTADYYYNNQDYDLAEDAYNAYVRSYPRSAEVPRVKLRAAFSSLAQFRGVRFDATSIIDARAQLVDIEKTYPEMAAEENVPSVIEQIDSAFAKKILETAQYYGRTHEPKAAVYHYRFLAQTYPNSPEAAEARARLGKMSPALLAEGPPPAAAGYAPATRPTAGAELH